MVSAIVLMHIERDLISQVAGKLAEIEGVSEVYSVAGEYDLVSIIRVPNNERLAEVVTERMRKIEGILDTETLISFRVFSNHDLESIFSSGID